MASSSKTAPGIFIFSIVLGAEYVKSIETHARTFLPLNISAVGSVCALDVKTYKIAFLKFQTKYFEFKKTSNSIRKY